jgi:hypothetical protein
LNNDTHILILLVYVGKIIWQWGLNLDLNGIELPIDEASRHFFFVKLTKIERTTDRKSISLATIWTRVGSGNIKILEDNISVEPGFLNS